MNPAGSRKSPQRSGAGAQVHETHSHPASDNQMGENGDDSAQAVTARRASEMLTVNQPGKRKCSDNEILKIRSYEKTTSKVPFKNGCIVVWEDPIQEEIEKTLIKGIQRLGLSDYVLKEPVLNNEIEVGNIGLEEELNENYRRPLKKYARLETKSRFENMKNVRKEGNWETFNRLRENYRRQGRPRKSTMQSESLGKKNNIRRNETKTSGGPKRLLQKKRPKELNDESEVRNIGLGEESNENYGMPLKKCARLETKSRFERIKKLRNEGNWERFNRWKEKTSLGRHWKYAVQGESQEKETDRRLKDSTVFGIIEKETKRPGKPKSFLLKKCPGRPKKVPKKKGPGRSKKVSEKEGPGRPKKVYEKKGPGRPKMVPEKKGPGRPKKVSEKKGPGRPKKVSEKKGPGRPKKVSEIKGPGRPKKVSEKEGPGRPKKVSEIKGPGRPKKVSEIKGPGRPKKASEKKGSGRPKEVSEKKGSGRPKKVSDKKGPGRPKKVSEIKGPGRPKKVSEKKGPGRPKKVSEKNGPGRPKKVSDKKGPGRPRKLMNKKGPGRPKTTDMNKIPEIKVPKMNRPGRSGRSPICRIGKHDGETKSKKTRGMPKESTISKMERHVGETNSKQRRGRPKISTIFKVEKYDGEAESKKRCGRSKMIKLNEIRRPKRGFNKLKSKSLDNNSNPVLHKNISRKVPLAIPFVRETSVLEKYMGLGVQNNAQKAKKSQRDSTCKETLTSATDLLSKECLPKETQIKEKVNDRSKLEEKSQTKRVRDDLPSVCDYKDQLLDKEPQGHENTGSYNHYSSKEKVNDIKLLGSENVSDLDQNSAGKKDGNQMKHKVKKVQLDKIGDGLTKPHIQKDHKKGQILPVENLASDENHNKRLLNLPSTQVVSHLTLPAEKNQASERYPSLEDDLEWKCKEEEHSSTSVRQGKSLKKFSKETQIKVRKRQEMEISAPFPRSSSVGSIMSKNSVFQKGKGKRPRKFSTETQIKPKKRKKVEAYALCPSLSSLDSIKSKTSLFWKGQAKRPRKSTTGTQMKSRKRVKLDIYAPGPSTSSAGSVKNKYVVSRKRVRKSIGELSSSQDGTGTEMKSRKRVKLDTSAPGPSTSGDTPKFSKGNVVSYIETDKDTEVNKNCDDCSTNSSSKVKKSFSNEDGSPKINAEIENEINSSVAPPCSENDSSYHERLRTLMPDYKKSGITKLDLKDFKVLRANHDNAVAGIEKDFKALRANHDNAVAGIEKDFKALRANHDNAVAGIEKDFKALRANHDNAVAGIEKDFKALRANHDNAVAGIEKDFKALRANHDNAVAGIEPKKKCISLAPGSEEILHTNECTSSVMPEEERQPVKKKDFVDEDSDEEVKLKLIPVIKYPGAVGSYHASMGIIRKWAKLLQAERSQHYQKPEPPPKEINPNNGLDTTGVNATRCSKYKSFFDISDDEDLPIPSDDEEDIVTDIGKIQPSTSKRINLSEKYGVKFLRKSSKKV